MSLSSLLESRRGPLWDWFEARFSRTRSVSTAANRELRGGSTEEPCVIPPVSGSDRGLVGTAVGYVLSAHLRPDALGASAATAGAHKLDRDLRRLRERRERRGRPSPRPDLATTDVERSVVDRVSELRPWERGPESPLNNSDWIELCELAGVLACFEQRHRAGPLVTLRLGRPLQQHRGDLRELANRLLGEPSLRDLDAVGRATIEDHIHIRLARELHIGPSFAQTGALGGADADLVYDSVLVDLKSTGTATVVGRHELWQLLGYLFADTDDRYAVRRVGVAALRQRRSVSWEAQELIGLLSGGSTLTVEHYRAEFAAMLVAAPSRSGPSATRPDVRAAR
jgi:hypothetical protein